VRVINASWGYQGESCKLLYDAIKYAGDECNILFVTAAGNDNRTDIDQTPFYPANYKLKNILVVASVDNNLSTISAYSNLGSSNVDIAALGTINSTTTIDGNTTATIQGTSFSTPMVARAAGILFNKYPTASADAVKNALLASAQRINGHDSVYIRSKGVLNLNAAFVYLDTLTQSQRSNCDTNRTDSTIVNHHVGVVVTDSNTELSIYPNPVQDQLNISFQSISSESVHIQILDMQGRILLQKNFAPNSPIFEFSTESLAQGFYLLRIHQGSQQWAAKLVKL
jgi:subtilisin family serine protease